LAAGLNLWRLAIPPVHRLLDSSNIVIIESYTFHAACKFSRMADMRRAFGLAIKLARTRRGWTQEQLGKAAGLDRGHISRIERGDLDAGITTQEKIAAALGLSLGELITQAEDEQERRRRRLGLGRDDDLADP
jgi:ribosome-binding protein aMBF1 (putative translation factor)